MKKILISIVILHALLCCIHAMGYEQETHVKLSEEATKASVLYKSDANVLSNLGLKPIDDRSQRFSNSKNEFKTINELIQDGGNFEDNFPRSTNHFFNPYNGQALSLSGVQVGNPSPDWALEDKGQIVGGMVLGGQEYSYRDGRSYFYLALTSSSSVERDKRWGQLFQTLGQVIHHIQDMAQPQHVRNDQHLELEKGTEIVGCLAAPVACAAYLSIKTPSAYEAHTKIRGAQLLYSGYAPVYSQSDRQTFNTPRKFWHTENQTPFAGKGLAEFTNQNFVSAGTNFDAPGMFAFPIKGSAIELDIKQLITNTSLTGTLTFWGSTVRDNYTGEVINNPLASTQSIFDADLKKKEKKPVNSLNSFNYDAANALLIPRAVGYSAGMINYFFRGEIDMVANPDIANGYRIKNRGTEPMNGRFALYYDDKEGKRQLVRDVSGKEMVWKTREIQGGPIEAGQSMDIVAEFTAPADAEVQDEYTLVFDGDIGEEKATGNNVGAVTAKRLKAVPYQGTLYIAGLDAANNLITLKVDNTGTTATAAGGDHPLYYVVEGLYNPRTDVSSYAGQRGRGHLSRQVEFVEGLNGMRYRTRAVSLRRSGFWAHTYGGAYSFVQGVDVKGASTLVAADSISWVAYSTDKTVGSFTFKLSLETGDITYVRSVEMAGKSVIVSSGLVAFPTGINAEQLKYIAQNGRFIISPDGLRIGEVWTTTSEHNGNWVSGGYNNVVSYHTLVIGLAAQPTMTKEISYTSTDTHTLKHPRPTCDECVLGNSKIVNRFALGYFMGESRFATETQIITALIDRFGSSSTSGRCTHDESTSINTKRIETQTELGGDSFSATYIEFPRSKNAHRITDQCRDASGNVISYSASTTYQSDVEDPYWKGKYGKAFNHRLADSIHTVDGKGLYFRGIPLVTDPLSLITLVYDASPIGEIFLATSDLRVVIHEPVAGGMKKIVIPPNMVKLLAAIWL